MKVAIVASECFPFAKMGGLADVVGALPKYLASLGVDVKVFIPKYGSINEKKFGLMPVKTVGEMGIRVAGDLHPVFLHSAVIPKSDVETYFVDCYDYFHRERIYTDDPDEDDRFILFNKAVIESLQRLKWAPDVIHCNDWQTGLMPLLVRDNYGWDTMFAATSFLFSIHNIGYQGIFSEEALTKGELNRTYFYPEGPLEFHESVSMLKAGIVLSDVVSTVSETYAREILTPEYGAGLQDVLRTKKDHLFGVLNGIDVEEWNPETDPFIPSHYSSKTLPQKKENKEALLKQTKIKFNDDIPVIGIISRLVSQKGFDVMADAINDLVKLNAQWVILGTGEARYEQLFKSMSGFLPGKCWTHIGFSNELAHMIEAGADMFLMPSHYEPCGLNQMYSLRYGTVPIVRKTGGLADTVLDWQESVRSGEKNGTGFSFSEPTPENLLDAVERAVDTYSNKKEWATIQTNGMNRDHSWTNSAKKYVALYEKAQQFHLQA